MVISSELIRSWYIGWYIKDYLEEKWLTITEVSEKIWSSRPTVNNMLNWRTSWSDNFFKRIMKWAWITDSEIKEIFKEADKEEYRYKHWEDVTTKIDLKTIASNEVGNFLRSLPIRDVIRYVRFSKSKTSTDEKTLDDIIKLAEMRIEQWDTWFLSALLKNQK